MSAIQISLSADLSKLEAEGFQLRIVHGDAYHLFVEGIPYVKGDGKVAFGTLYSSLVTDAAKKTVNPIVDHQCWWIGDSPCDVSGRVMTEMISNPSPTPKGDKITVDVGFSRKHADKRNYADYHEKIWTYVREIWHEARELDPSCDPRSEKPVQVVVEGQERAFRYADMATTRAGIGAATSKLLAERVAIVGIGGTGSYILDLIAKTPVAEIHIFDGDEFEIHNAFRAPGAPREDELTDPKKVNWFGDIYDRMHRGIKRHAYNLTLENLAELSSFDFVFVAVDDGESRKAILQELISMKVSFIDVGLDIAFDQQHALRGLCRFTVGTPEHHSHVEEVVSFAKAPADALYRNIQVADLNMLNAAMAVGKWKQMRGFYADDMREHHSIYNTATHALTKEDRA